MKIARPISFALVISCAVLIVFTCFKAYYSAGTDSRRLQNIHIMRLLALGVQMYREQTQSYPNSFSDIYELTKSQKGFNEFRDGLSQARSNIWHDVYVYQLSTNGFAITVAGYDCAPVGWFGKKRTFEHEFKSDDPFNDLNN